MNIILHAFHKKKRETKNIDAGRRRQREGDRERIKMIVVHSRTLKMGKFYHQSGKIFLSLV